MQGVSVSAFTIAMPGGGSGSAMTDADGVYVVSGLAPGDYWVQFSGPMGSNLVSEYHPNTTNYSMAVQLKVSAGARVAGIDASLAAGASITGHVTDSQGQPLQGVNVSFSSVTIGGTYASAMTDGRGVYAITGLLAGDYRVQFAAPLGSNLVSEYLPDTTNISLAVPVKVSAGASLTGIDASLSVGASITGRVTDDQGRPVQGVNVSATSTATTTDFPKSAMTDVNGVYVITGLAAGDFRVQFSGPMGSNLLSEYHPDTTNSSLAVPVKVAAGAMVTGIDASLASGASITGHVTDSQGRPVQGVNVWVNPTLMMGGGSGNATTNANGDYLVSGLAAGDYRVQFSTPMGSNLVSEYHPDTTDYSLAVPVKVVAGATVPGSTRRWRLVLRSPDTSPMSRVIRFRASTCRPARPRCPVAAAL